MSGDTYKRLVRAGVRDQANAYREEIRKRLQNQGKTRKEIKQIVDEEVWVQFKPLVEKHEKQKEKQKEEKADTLIGCPQNVDQLLDPQYNENDPGIWIRDGIVWAAQEIRRVVQDKDGNTTINIENAKKPPPTAWAVFVIEAYARKPPAQRAELITKVMPFANRSYENIPEKEQQTSFSIDDIS